MEGKTMSNIYALRFKKRSGMKTSGMKTSDLTRRALDWAVAKCLGHRVADYGGTHIRIYLQESAYTVTFCPSTEWAHGGPIIEREGILLARRGDHSFSPWGALLNGFERFEFDEEGATPLIAAMRCYVASKLGDEVEIPDELTKGEVK